MTELQKIVQLFTDLQNGECWIGVNLQGALAGVNADTAVLKRNETGNNIWQLVNHLIYWRKTVMIRLSGKNERPERVDFYFPEERTEIVWKQTLTEFEKVSAALLNTIKGFDAGNLDLPSPKKEQTYYQLMMGCLQHDAYHMGQIVLLKNNGME